MPDISVTGENESRSPDAAPAPPPILQSPATTPDLATAPSGVPAKQAAPLWLRRGDQAVVGLLVVSLLMLLSLNWLRLSRWGTAPVELSSVQPREYYYSLDINAASWVEWAQLDGIGEKLARRIVEDRDERGPFATAADVGRVRGIGPKLLEKIKPFLHGGTSPDDRPDAL